MRHSPPLTVTSRLSPVRSIWATTRTNSSGNNGVHNLALNGEVTIENASPITAFNLRRWGRWSAPDDLNTPFGPTRVFLTGSDAQNVLISDVNENLSLDRVTMRNTSGSGVDIDGTSSSGLIVGSDLSVTGGNLTTNGLLGMDGATLTLNKSGTSASGELLEGNSNSILDGEDIPYLVQSGQGP